ncbi:MAG: hypothetical protein ACLQFR_29115 [Streptosporangiaceae bacterium]
MLTVAWLAVLAGQAAALAAPAGKSSTGSSAGNGLDTSLALIAASTVIFIPAIATPAATRSSGHQSAMRLAAGARRRKTRPRSS